MHEGGEERLVKVILDTGAASFPILEKQIDRYVEGTRASAAMISLAGF